MSFIIIFYTPETFHFLNLLNTYSQNEIIEINNINIGV